MSPFKNKKVYLYLSFVLIFAAFTYFLTYPLVPLAKNYVFDKGDGFLVNWILSWEYHSLTNDIKNIFNANIFYPYQNTLAYTENFLGVLPIFSFFYYLTKNNILATNAVLIASFILSGTFMSWLVYYLTKNYLVSISAGFIFAFSPVRFAQLSHIHVLNFYWFPLSILFLFKYFKTNKKRYLFFYSLFLFLLLLSSLNSGIIGLFGAGFFSITKKQKILSFLIASCFSVFLFFPVARHYFNLDKSQLVLPSFQESQIYSADIAKSYLNIGPYTQNSLYLDKLQKFRHNFGDNEKWLFPGFLPLILSGLSLFFVKKRKIFSWLFVGFFGFIFSLGPRLIINEKITFIRLPYAFVRYLPGISSIRTPGRYAILVVFSLAVLSALFLAKIWQQKLSTKLFLFAITICLLSWEFKFVPLPLQEVKIDQEIIENAQWLKQQPASPILQLPTGKFKNGNPEWIYKQTEYMLYSTYHWQPMINGYSGAFPKDFFDNLNFASQLPDEKYLDHFKKIGVKFLLVHFDKLTPEEAEKWEKTEKSGLIKKIKDTNQIIYEL